MQQRDIAIIIGVVVLVVLLAGILGGGMMMGPWMMGPGMMGWGGFGFSPLWGIVMLIFWLLVIGGIVLLAVWLFRQFVPTEVAERREGRALEILRERYARGEITREEYEQMRRDLEGR